MRNTASRANTLGSSSGANNTLERFATIKRGYPVGILSSRFAASAVALLALLAVLTFGAASSQAAIVHPYSGTSLGPGGVGSGSFGNVQGVTVEQSTGDVLVFDATNGGRLYKFDAAGKPVNFPSTGTNAIEGVGSAGNAEEEVAVDESGGLDAGDIYVANNNVVRIYASSGASIGELSGGEMCGVAVDPSGNVYVGIYGEGAVRRYASSTSPVTNADETGSLKGLAGVCNVAADAAGDVYVAKWSGGVRKYEALQFGSLAASGTPVDENGRTLAVDATANEVFIDEQSSISQYDGSTEPPALRGVSGAAGAGALQGSFGVGVDHASGKVYAADGEVVEIFGAGVTVAGVSTEGSTNLTGTEATLHGTIEPAGTEVTGCAFEYGASSELTQSAACEPAGPYTGSTPVAVTAHLTGLNAGTVYGYRIIASGAGGSVNGAVKSFATRGPRISNSEAGNLSLTKVVAHAAIEPAGEATTYHVQYGTSTAYGSNTPDAELQAGEEPVTVSVPLAGLQPATTYHFRFVASNTTATATGADVEFTTPAVVTNESFSNVGATTASMSADIAPGGQPTSYEVEYGTSAAYGSSTSPVSVGSGEAPVSVSSSLGELQPGTTYHFRFVAITSGGTAAGPDLLFTTQTLTNAGLPDGRGYEMVTPAENVGFEIYAPISAGWLTEDSIYSFLPFEASADGSAVTYAGDPTAGGNGNQGDGGGNQLFARRTAGGWIQHDIQPPGFRGAGYWGFSSDLRYGLLESTERLVEGVPGSGYQDLYAHDNETGASQPLVAGTPPYRSPQTFGLVTPGSGGSAGQLGGGYAGASADFTHLLFEANDALTPEAAGGPEEMFARENNLYELADGRLRSVNVLPDGTPAPNASFGSAETGSSEVDFSHVISSDGARIFWTDLNNGSLYVREDGSATKLIAEEATFLTASADGSKVLYTQAGELYEDDVETGLTRSLAPSGEVMGILGAGEDLQFVYFVAKAVLAPGASAGGSNLYLSHDGETRFIATLGTSSEEYEGMYPSLGAHSPWTSNLANRTAEVTPSGRDVVFMSVRSLTGYDNRGRSNSLAEPETYVYDAERGALSCASCDPTGERPAGGGELAGQQAGGFLAIGAYPTYQLRVISEDGSRVFFESAEPLLPQTKSGVLNVYEWERDGAGSCSFANGCLYLLSTGSSSTPSYFVDASANGNDVFLITRSQLTPADQNEYNDVYDARVGALEAPSSSQCTGTGCQGVAASPPVFATPASVTYDGVGNLAARPAPVAKHKPKPKTKKKRKKTSGCAIKHKSSAPKGSAKRAKVKPGSALCKARKAAKRVRRTNGRGGR
jgi:hypothetical protein